MWTVFDERHLGHDPASEMANGRLVPYQEAPERVDRVLARLRSEHLGPVAAAEPFPSSSISKVHTAPFLRFLERAWAGWSAERPDSVEALPEIWPVRGMRPTEPETFVGKLGFFASDAAAPIVLGTWAAARAAVDVALTAQRRVAAGDRAAFALCRPPGHHATPDATGGYCYLNNAAIAAEAFLEQGAQRVAVLDVDYHAGNGTQQVFYERADVFVASLHADPRSEYPFFLGHADERGRGAGEGAHLNLPLPLGTDWSGYGPALDVACGAVERHGAEALVVSLGVDTFAGDPLCQFRLRSEDFSRLGERIAALGRPTLFVFEGGYALDALGENVARVLTAFEGRS